MGKGCQAGRESRFVPVLVPTESPAQTRPSVKIYGLHKRWRWALETEKTFESTGC